ncbi:uncharacterized protein LOC110021581 [Phalaenopsis equestris]|uniref:uncharacterized protein LOC110021581 n=1 Tax=Phalaenopsis equestris TaxID=78828 RepID=UPI0009E23668|nr:uncharacterized protein LOC110021581 [Phalaenopsis equestris]XP_020575791.1 uncharacterized protein LOC110021581 [Phalaenopsis equestris]
MGEGAGLTEESAEGCREMCSGDVRGLSWRHLVLLTLFALQLIPGFGVTPSTSKVVGANESSKSSGSSGRVVLLICLGLAAFVALSVFIFKLWQRKKREEQYARLLKLFEEDDELELELGLRD